MYMFISIAKRHKNDSNDLRSINHQVKIISAMLTLNTFHVSEHFFKSAKSLAIYICLYLYNILIILIP